MHVEECSQALLAHLLPGVDAPRAGLCIDVGVGTFALYCEMFAKLGFPTVAVEPVPGDTVRRICSRHAIRLLEACLSDSDGTETLYLGTFEGAENLNLCSLSPDWWGASSKTRRVRCLSFPTLLSDVAAPSITCLKIDVEGAEFRVIRQLRELPVSLLPSVVMFEYGGGGSKGSGRGGWSAEFFQATVDSLGVLHDCGYGFSIMVDSAEGVDERLFDLRSVEVSGEALFPEDAVYGNIICLRGEGFDERKLHAICAAYRDHDSKPPALHLGDSQSEAQAPARAHTVNPRRTPKRSQPAGRMNINEAPA
ncbi:MAG: FkbM family methyltransferase [bacterium]|nr:FkbM family methyltransferase [bacterium]